MILISKHFTILFLRSFSFDGEDIQTLETVFDFFSKHLEVSSKNSAARRICSSILGVRKCVETRSGVFDILLPKLDLKY